MSEIEKNKDNGLNPLRKEQPFVCDGLSMEQVLALLTELEHLEADWSASGAAAPNKTALANSARATETFEHFGLFPRDVGPSVESGVCFIFEVGRHYGAVEFFNDGMVSFLIDTNGKNRKVWEVNGEETQLLNDSIQRIQDHLRS